MYLRGSRSMLAYTRVPTINLHLQCCRFAFPFIAPSHAYRRQTAPKPMMKSIESLTTKHSHPSPRIILPPPSSPIMPPKPNQHLADQDEYQRAFKTLASYAKTAPLLLLMYQQYKTSRTHYTLDHTLAIPLQQPDTTPDQTNNTNKPKPSPSNTSSSLLPSVLLKKAPPLAPLPTTLISSSILPSMKPRMDQKPSSPTSKHSQTSCSSF